MKYEFVPGDAITIAPGRTVKRIRGTIDEFLAKSETEHDDQTHLEYRMLIEVAYMRITRARSAK
jgi:hypothetical protein